MGSPGSPSLSSSQTAPTQPWLSSGSQVKPPLPTPSPRPQASSQSFQQRSHVPQQYLHNMPTTPQQQTISSGQQPPQSSGSTQPLEHYSQQIPASRIQQPLSHQQQATRGLGSQRPPLGMTQSGTSHLGAPSKTAPADIEESSNRIVSKRSIQELVNQVKMLILFFIFCPCLWIIWTALVFDLLLLILCKGDDYVRKSL